MKQKIRHFIYFIILLVVDQVSKYWARMTLQEEGPISLISGLLKLQYHENTGAVWGIMAGKTDLLTIITIILSLFLLILYFKIPEKKRLVPMQIIWVFIMAGAIGNLIDRITLKYVVDFIYFELINFPIFNIADSYLTVSCALLLILGIFYYKDDDLDFIDNLFKKKKSNIGTEIRDSKSNNLVNQDLDKKE